MKIPMLQEVLFGGNNLKVKAALRFSIIHTGIFDAVLTPIALAEVNLGSPSERLGLSALKMSGLLRTR